MRAWAEVFPPIVRVTSLGTTPEARVLWVSTADREPERSRPAAWIDGNMRASERAGSSAARAIAEDAIRAHLTL